MNRRRTGQTLGLTVGGSVAAVLMSAAVAAADTGYTIAPADGSPETVTGMYGMFGLLSAGPALNETVQGHQTFTFTGPDGTQGTFEGAVATIPYLSDSTNREVIVLDSPGNSPDAPPPGSIFDTVNFGFGFQNVYSAIASETGGASKVTDTLVTPLGNINLGWLFGDFDASEGLAVGKPLSALPPGIEPISAPEYTSISALPPVAVGVGAEQQFQVVDADGNQVGTFDAVVAYTHDGAGWNTEAILVTNVLSGTPGTAPGDVPPVGSVFNTAVHTGALINLTNVYSDLASTGSGNNTISDTLSIPALGIKNLDLSWLFGLDAAKGLHDGFPFAEFKFDGYTIAPDPASPETYNDINGLPPLHVVVQGYQQFNLLDSSGDVVGTFSGEETTGNVWGTPQQSLIITQVGPDSSADVPLAGSVFNVSALPFGMDLVYADLVTESGGEKITETLVTPLGNLDLSPLAQGIHAAAGMADVLFAYP